MERDKVRQGRIIVLVWDNGSREYYSSISAIFAKNQKEDVGAARNTVKCMMSRKGGVYVTKKCVIKYEPLWIAERGPRSNNQMK